MLALRFVFHCGLRDALLPFAIRYGSATFAPPKLAAFIGLESSLLAMTLGTLLPASSPAWAHAGDMQRLTLAVCAQVIRKLNGSK